MRFLITLVILALLGSPAFAKSKSAVQAPSVFTGKLLTYEQLIALPKEKRMKYLKNMVDLLATMESFNNRYTVAENSALRDFRDQVAQLMQMMSVLPEARADEFTDTAPPVDVSKIIPAWNGAEWTCGRGAVFDYVMRACMVTNAAGYTNYTARSEADDGDKGEPCPPNTKEVPHYRAGSVACIPNANWDLISTERRSGIEKRGFLSPGYLRSKPLDEQRAEVLGGVPSEDPASRAPKAPGAVAGDETPPPAVAVGASNPPPAATDMPASVKCAPLNAADRQTAIDRYGATAPFQGVDANVCIAGGFASKYASAKKSPGTCEIKRALDLGGGRKTAACKSDEALCNPVLFCVGGKNAKNEFEPVTFCVKKVGDRFNRAITDSCATKYARKIANQEPLLECQPIDRKWSAAKKRAARAACDVAKKVKGEACDPKYLPADVEFKKIWEDLVTKTQKLRDVWCGNQDFAKLFCRECEVVSDKIYAMNKEATGSGAPEVRAPAQGAPAAPVPDPHPASIER